MLFLTSLHSSSESEKPDELAINCPAQITLIESAKRFIFFILLPHALKVNVICLGAIEGGYFVYPPYCAFSSYLEDLVSSFLSKATLLKALGGLDFF